MADAVVDSVTLLLVPCPDCGRNVVTYVVRRCQNGVERFYKCRSHILSQPARGGCDFYRCPQAYAESLAAADQRKPSLHWVWQLLVLVDAINNGHCWKETKNRKFARMSKLRAANVHKASRVTAYTAAKEYLQEAG
ncbi:uncharacterized protein LOC119368048 isoform X1 [Triticum dicoccoides]|uniref:uncharacterized protein LOC119368048 isoform X1 n=1 Tax=Triticum dicoccoides TaxID=85692 RepID=UPI000E7920C7|nr:uncharacterized protein LOC119368048 isoform X1 [Triticum dicoccoides]